MTTVGKVDRRFLEAEARRIQKEEDARKESA